MLKQLYIQNFTLIDELDITFHPGFSVITGETGAGKSIILGAIGLLLGNRADVKAIKSGKSKCVVEAHFDLSRYDMQAFFRDHDIDEDADDCIIRREINSNGKSRAFINDTPVPLTVMRDLGEQLVDIHSQHQNLLLNKEDFQLNVIDIIADDKKQLADYQSAYSAYNEAEKRLQSLQEEIARNKENEEFMRFQEKELDEAALVEDEQTEKEKELETLNHAEEIKSGLYEADHAFNEDEEGIVEKLKGVSSALSRIETVYPDIKDINRRIDSSYIELKDIAQDISDRLENFDFDTERQEMITERLDQIYSLERKFHTESVKELIEIRDHLKEQLQHIDHGDEELAERQADVDQKRKACEEKSTQLTAIRQKAATKIEKEMRQRLIPLGIPNVRFEIQVTSKPLSPNGCDKVCFLFSANKSTPVQPVSQVASGGEIARVMLSLKAMISGAVKLPTIIFDEIDTGVSGRVAEQMAQIMQEMGNHDRQVISITHLPQIAALGTTHYKVSKEETPTGTISRMVMLTPEQRIQEIAQMLSGSNISEAAIQNAKTLLGL